MAEKLESARRCAGSYVVMNEELASTLEDRDTTIASLTSKIETAEVIREQLSRFEKENEELKVAHREESKGYLHAQTELEVRCAAHYPTISAI